MSTAFFKKAIVLSAMFLWPHLGYAVDNPHFYKAPYLNATKSWKSKKWLSIFDAHYAHGISDRSRNSSGNKVDTFNLYGNHNLLYATANVPQPAALSAVLQGYVNALDIKRDAFETANPADKQSFGLVDFCGTFGVDEFVFNYRQNLVYKFFSELNVPVRRIRTGPLTLVDRSPVGTPADPDYTQRDDDWTNFRDNFPAIMQAYGLESYICRTITTNLGDISFLLGWQHMLLKKAELFEYLKVSIKAGALFPTGAHRKHTKPFSIETGYNDHFGFPVRADAIFGLSSDIYIGSYVGLLFFSSKTHNNFPVKTHERQNGFIKLCKVSVLEKKGPLFDGGVYLKLDHFFLGLSALIGYSYNHQGGDSLTLANCCDHTSNPLINSDCRLQDWDMHAMHLVVEYDFGVHNYFKKRSWQPRISAFYDYPFRGERVITTSLFGGTIGCDLSWLF